MCIKKNYHYAKIPCIVNQYYQPINTQPWLGLGSSLLYHSNPPLSVFFAMASGMKYIWWVVVTIMGLSIVVSSTMQEWDEVGEDHPPQVPCFFIFGDSLADSGNNNLLITLAKVNYQPYGIDFPHGPTGRFCNGRTTVDIIGPFSINLNPLFFETL